MNEYCICCGELVPEGRQVCWHCENSMVMMGKILQSENSTEEEVDEAYDFVGMCKHNATPPSEKQIKLADEIAEMLNIDFPQSSADFTATNYWRFINEHIKEVREMWDDDEARGGGFYDDLMYFSPINQ